MTVGVPWPGMKAPEVSATRRIQVSQEILDQRGAEFAFHERVAGDLPDPAGLLATLGQGEELGHKRHGQAVLPLAYTRVLGAIDLVESLVLDGDVGRVSNDDVEPASFSRVRRSEPSSVAYVKDM